MWLSRVRHPGCIWFCRGQPDIKRNSHLGPCALGCSGPGVLYGDPFSKTYTWRLWCEPNALSWQVGLLRGFVFFTCRAGPFPTSRASFLVKIPSPFPHPATTISLVRVCGVMETSTSLIRLPDSLQRYTHARETQLRTVSIITYKSSYS